MWKEAERERLAGKSFKLTVFGELSFDSAVSLLEFHSGVHKMSEGATQTKLCRAKKSSFLQNLGYLRRTSVEPDLVLRFQRNNESSETGHTHPQNDNLANHLSLLH